MTGRQRLPVADASLTAPPTSLPPLVLPGGANPSAARVSNAAPHFPDRRLLAAELPMESSGWSRPFSPQSLYPREGLLPTAGFRHGVDQVGKPHHHLTIIADVPKSNV